VLFDLVGGRALHVVEADGADDDERIVVIVYEPDPALWQPGFRRVAANDQLT
jgi:hypothetical protein